METICTIKALRERLRKARSSSGPDFRIGLVPTMGSLHDGHASLMRTAKAQCNFVVTSVFVNPIQFDQNVDYVGYPKNEDNDLRLAQMCGVDVMFMPDVNEIYPDVDGGVSLLTTVSVAKLTEIMCGRSRRAHFIGVATVVTKLLNIVQPDAAYFGMKDAQQLAVVQRMVKDLNVPVDIVPCPTVRDDVDGLAMSSRNSRLSRDERKQATIIPDALKEATSEARRPGATVRSLLAVVKNRIASCPSALLDYVDIAYYPSMVPLDDWEMSVADAAGPFVVALAVVIGKARLIDNQVIDIKSI